jgi:hypothetical protein
MNRACFSLNESGSARMSHIAAAPTTTPGRGSRPTSDATLTRA